MAAVSSPAKGMIAENKLPFLLELNLRQSSLPHKVWPHRSTLFSEEEGL